MTDCTEHTELSQINVSCNVNYFEQYHNNVHNVKTNDFMCVRGYGLLSLKRNILPYFMSNNANHTKYDK